MKSFLPAVVLLFALTVPAYAQSPLFIGSAFEPPISSPGQKGIADRIARQAFARIGEEARITPLPAERSLLNAAQGINDGDLIRVEGLQRHYPDLIQVPEKLIDFEFVAFSKSPDFKIRSWDDLSPYSVGIVRGWKILEQRGAGALLTRVDSLALLFTLLAKGRADLVVYERLAGIQAVQNLQLKGIHPHEPPLEVQPMYLYLHKRHEALVAPLVAALKAMKQDGSYRRIVSEGLQPLIGGGSAWSD
jgi:polar amino acid transport system substrate-binding protein